MFRISWIPGVILFYTSLSPSFQPGRNPDKSIVMYVASDSHQYMLRILDQNTLAPSSTYMMFPRFRPHMRGHPRLS